HYVDEGSGRPILLLHGNPTWGFLYRKIIAELRVAGFRCLAPDLLGYGLSDHPASYGYTAAEQAEVILGFIRHLDLRGMLVMGQDWGGPLSLWAAAQEPDRVRGMILGSTFGWPATGAIKLIARALRSGRVQRYIAESDRFIERVIRGLAQ